MGRGVGPEPTAGPLQARPGEAMPMRGGREADGADLSDPPTGFHSRMAWEEFGRRARGRPNPE
jgi:hypothetical protein